MATATAKPDGRAAPARAGDPAAGARQPSRPLRRRHPLAGLTVRILAVNILALVILVAGLFYLDQFRAGLVEAKTAALLKQGEMIAAALGDGAVVVEGSDRATLDREAIERMLPRLAAPTGTRVRLFDLAGGLLADSERLAAAARGVETRPLPPPEETPNVIEWLDDVYRWTFERLPADLDLPRHRERLRPTAADFPEVRSALTGEAGSALRVGDDGQFIVSAAVPVQRFKRVLGAVMLADDGSEIQEGVREVRIAILQVFAGTLAVTVLLSLFLARTIAAPIRTLAAVAEQVRRGPGQRIGVPDFSSRRDEIADLAHALAEMTAALYRRLDAIEAFAADVAHEIRNPLTSIRSAIETLARTRDPAQQQRLIDIVLADIGRLNRLVSDISDASRLDAELARAAYEPVDLAALVRALVEVAGATAADAAPRLEVEIEPGARLTVAGIEDRLGQVLRNLLSNAISFSPPGGRIHVRLAAEGTAVALSVEDDGPGIPHGKEEAIFERFYTARPGADFGTHSGLGLSISRQIVEAHGGTIAAANRIDGDGRIAGARFVVRLPAAPTSV